MTRSDGDEQIEERLRRAKPGEMPAPDFAAWAKTHAEEVEILQGQRRMRGVKRISWSFRFRSLSRVAALVAVVLALGFGMGRFSVGSPPDIQGLRLELEASLREEVIEPMGLQWQATLRANHDQLRKEILQQLHRDLGDIANQTLAASRVITDQRMTELIRLIEAARERDRQRVAFALEQIEANRRRDRIQFGSGLQLLAAHTAEASDRNTN